jgi:anti-sigma B factor antagonist
MSGVTPVRPDGAAEFVRAPGDAAVLSVRGEVDVSTAEAFRAALYALVDETAPENPVIVDMGGVGFIDSSGLGVLVGALKRARERGSDLRVRNLTPVARKVFDITGLTELFQAG